MKYLELQNAIEEQ